MGWNIKTEEKDASEKEKRDWHVWQGSSSVWKKVLVSFIGLVGAVRYGYTDSFSFLGAYLLFEINK